MSEKTKEDTKGDIAIKQVEYYKAITALSILLLAVLPFVSLVIGLAVRCFMWAAGLRGTLF